MQQHIGQMRSHRTGAKYFRVEHERQPRQRMPVGGIFGSESPQDTVPGQSRLHLGIGGEILMVIKIEEWVPEGLAEDCKHGQRQQKAHAPNRAFVV